MQVSTYVSLIYIPLYMPIFYLTLLSSYVDRLDGSEVELNVFSRIGNVPVPKLNITAEYYKRNVEQSRKIALEDHVCMENRAALESWISLNSPQYRCI